MKCAQTIQAYIQRGVIVAIVGGSIVSCTATPQTPQQLQSRLSAAEQISSDWSRDQALASIAIDAAKAGNAGMCVQAADQIQADPLRDLTVSTCVQWLQKKGLPADISADITARIGNDNIRDQVLALLAKAKPPTMSAAKTASTQ